MGNCAASKLGGWDEEAVSLCRGRMRLLKAAVERRRALAEAQLRYVRSIHAVAGAINLFVARHSPPSPVLITLPSPSLPPSSADPAFLLQTEAEPKTEALPCRSSVSSSTCSPPALEFTDGRAEDGREVSCGYFYAQMPMAPAPLSPTEAYGWDFFNPFEGLGAAGYGRSSDEDLRAVREQEGIPDLEEEAAHEAKRGLTPATSPTPTSNQKEDKMAEERGSQGAAEPGLPEKRIDLLDALKDVEEEFIKAYNSGRELARMLESNTITVQPEIAETKIKGCFFAGS